MATIRATDLATKLARHAQDGLARADANKSGVITSSEDAALPASVRDNVQKHRAQAGTVRTQAFQDAFGSYVRQELSRVDSNRDGFVSDAEQARLATDLRDNVSAVLAPAASGQPATPAASGVFGISGTVPASKVKLNVILSQGLAQPTSLAFNPHDKSLWVVNRADDSSVVLDGVGSGGRMSARKYQDRSSHFMNNPMQISFSKTRNEFGTVQETDNDYNGAAAGNMFMGPTLFTGDRRHYEGGADSHLDMLHHSPLAVGIAAGAKASSAAADKREYWVFNGQKGSVDRYLFNQPHALGADDHSDGQTLRYAPGSLKRAPNVPGHLAYDDATGQLFIADSGNGRIAKLDTRADVRGSTRIASAHDETPLYQVPNTRIDSVTKPGAVTRPSGLLIHNNHLVVADHATGKIKVFTKDGQPKGEVDTGLGPHALTGLAAGPDNKLYFLDAKSNRLLQLQVNP